MTLATSRTLPPHPATREANRTRRAGACSRRNLSVTSHSSAKHIPPSVGMTIGHPQTAGRCRYRTPQIGTQRLCRADEQCSSLRKRMTPQRTLHLDKRPEPFHHIPPPAKQIAPVGVGASTTRNSSTSHSNAKHISPSVGYGACDVPQTAGRFLYR